MLLLPVLLNQTADGRALWVPEREPGPGFLVEAEQVKRGPELAMVPSPGLLQPFEVRFEQLL